MMIKTKCEACPNEFGATRWNARYCSPSCRNKAYRQRRKAEAEAAAQAEAAATSERSSAGAALSVEGATRTQLAALKLDRTALGLSAIATARRVDEGDQENGSAFAALVRVHATSLMRALEQSIGSGGKTGGGDGVDELRRKREERRQHAGHRR
jgi:hypothetical protein